MKLFIEIVLSSVFVGLVSFLLVLAAKTDNEEVEFLVDGL